jgi:mannose-6-phosphate isomerase-like protein (cupin superfamily)
MNEPQLHVRESDCPKVPDICGTSVDLINKEISSSKNISLGVVYIKPGKSSTRHYHKVTEEIYYFLEGYGRVIIEDHTFTVSPGSSVYIPLGKWHQVINDSTKHLKLLSADTPPYDTEDIFTV